MIPYSKPKLSDFYTLSQTKQRHIPIKLIYESTPPGENSNNSERKRAGISHGGDRWIQTETKSQPTIISLEIDGVRKQLSRRRMSMVDFVVKTLPFFISLAIW